MPTGKKAMKPAQRAGRQAATGGHPLEGKKAPDFVLSDQDGKQVALRDLIAKGPLVLYFYPKDMTPGCTTEACSFRDNREALRAAGATVVGVSADSATSHQKFIAKHELNFPLLVDADNKVAKAYGVYKKKSLYGREFMGIERTTFIIGGDGIVRKVFAKVRVNGHTDEVLEALRHLG
ncbi:MAG TPA: thioredoxin-dependent thiol peroxidase [Candidatus Binataceae bacterium]|jgi:peroxiredoxin Q/BCP|nr:thioredoxin-dependent thiol peroxidase [Candidatus Binataceae bacterium]